MTQQQKLETLALAERSQSLARDFMKTASDEDLAKLRDHLDGKSLSIHPKGSVLRAIDICEGSFFEEIRVQLKTILS